MPLMKLHVIKGRTTVETERLLDTVHDVMVQVFDVPIRDRYQILTEYEPAHLKALDTGLDMTRTDNFILLEVVTRPRSREQKVAFYEQLAQALADRCNIAKSDIMVSVTQNTDEDWSFGDGQAQFLTGQLG